MLTDCIGQYVQVLITSYRIYQLSILLLLQLIQLHSELRGSVLPPTITCTTTDTTEGTYEMGAYTSKRLPARDLTENEKSCLTKDGISSQQVELYFEL